MPTFAIGDIHGCDTALANLLEVAAPASGDLLVFLGDYIDRGPGSRMVMDLLIAQSETLPCVFLRGNHEVMILDSRDDPLKANLWRSYGGFEALCSYGSEFRDDWVSSIPDRHWRFWEDTVQCFETPTHIFVHACVDPDLAMEDQPEWLTYWEFFENIRPHKSGKKIICGHTSDRSGAIRDVGFAACIDTGAAMGGWLTCLDVDSGRYWQANEKGAIRERCLGR